METIDGIARIFEGEIYGIALTRLGLAVAVAAGTLIVALLARLILERVLPAAKAGEELHWPAVLHELVARTSTLVLVVVALYAGAALLSLPDPVQRLISSAFVIALFVQLALWGDRLASALIAWRLAPAGSQSAMRNALSLIRFLVRVAVWSLALLLIFENLGFNVTALVAGLGVGGIAVALAAQSVLGDLFSSLAIILDRPFEVGDTISFGDQTGTVERIGIKTTRIRALTGEQVAVSNSDLVSARVHNFKRMTERRVLLVLGVTYDTPADKLEGIPERVKRIIEGQDTVRFDRAHFRSFGDSALQFEIVYWVQSADYGVFMDCQQAINFAVFRAFEEDGIEFAFPSQTLYVPGLERADDTELAGSERS